VSDCEANECESESEVGLALMDETDVVKHYGEFCKDHYQRIDKVIEEATFELRNLESNNSMNSDSEGDM